jgi:hypothetical protein
MVAKRLSIRDFEKDAEVAKGTGVVEVHILRPNDMTEALIHGLLGRLHPTVSRLMEIVMKYFDDVASRGAGKGSLCLCCDREFGPRRAVPSALLIVVPAFKVWQTDDAVTMVCGVCSACDTGDDAVRAAALKHLGARDWTTPEAAQ